MNRALWRSEDHDGGKTRRRPPQSSLELVKMCILISIDSVEKAALHAALPAAERLALVVALGVLAGGSVRASTRAHIGA